MMTVCMIPARGNSKRIPKKNLRILGDKPLCCWAIEAAKKAGCFDKIYLNSEDLIFEQIANEYGINFYKRPDYYSQDNVNNDEFMYDFLKNVECDCVVQVLPTSPFITGEQIKEFLISAKESKTNTLVSVKNVQIECVYNNKPINFSELEYTLPSQILTPIQSYAASLMFWDKETYLKNFEDNGGAYHGYPNGHTSYFPLKGYATIDIDTEEDWQLAEVVAEKIMLGRTSTPQYYDPENVTSIEASVPEILLKDGVINNDLFNVNELIVNIGKIIEENKLKSNWSKRVIDSSSNSATLICQDKNFSNRLHKHYFWNEWWVILQGVWIFEIDNERLLVEKGDIVFIEAGKKHKITSMEDKSIRLAISRADIPHVYVKQ